MPQIRKKRNSKFEIRNSKLGIHYQPGESQIADIFLWCKAWGRAIPEIRISRFLSRLSSCAAGCLSPTAYCLLLSAFCLLLFTGGCGYHVAGRGDLIPPDVKTIAVPAFKNETPTFHIEQQLTSSVTRELLERTHFQVTPNPDNADAVLKGTVKDIRSGVIAFDLNTGAATALQIQVTADVRLEDLHSHKVLYSNDKYIFREQYQVNPSPSRLFEEDKPALERLSRDLARTLVTDILESF
jgi:outer membrane lipopolysaccharide assembly protein LptE/RlpB